MDISSSRAAPRNFSRPTFLCGARPDAQEAAARLRAIYGDAGAAQADVLVVIGGDGQMLDVLRSHLTDDRPVFGMNRGTVGFLLNAYQEHDLMARLNAAKAYILHPLRMEATRLDGSRVTGLAVNEVSLLRQSSQSARLRVFVDERERLAELVCDGAMVATPAGSTAYNLSAHGPIIPLGTDLLALTPISVFRPRRWRGALLRANQTVRFEVLDPALRPVAASADNQDSREVAQVTVSQARDIALTLLFDPGDALEERILAEQFAP